MSGFYPEPGDDERRTDGWSGSEASHDRAIHEQESGKAQRRRDLTIRHLSIMGTFGSTWTELADSMGWHHGQASGVLSVMHKEGRISSLRERRGRCHIYVLNELTEGREVWYPKGFAPSGGEESHV